MSGYLPRCLAVSSSVCANRAELLFNASLRVACHAIAATNTHHHLQEGRGAIQPHNHILHVAAPIHGVHLWPRPGHKGVAETRHRGILGDVGAPGLPLCMYDAVHLWGNMDVTHAYMVLALLPALDRDHTITLMAPQYKFLKSLPQVPHGKAQLFKGQSNICG